MTIERWKWVAIGILGISVFSLMALTTEQKDEMVRLREISTQDNNEVASLNEFVRKLAPNLFDSLKNKPGDIIAGMTVLSIEPDLSGPLTNDNVYAKFSGKTTISGEYDFGQDEVNGGDFLTFQVTDPKERIKIPMMLK